MLAAGEMEDRRVELTIEQKAVPMMFTGMGMEQMDIDLQGMFEKILPKNTSRREMTVAEARRVLFEQECDALINQEKVNATAIDLAENVGIIFVDEIDKIVASEPAHGADVSRQGVQRDLLPIVEGTTVQTRYGYVQHRPHSVHRRRRVPPRQAERPDARAARPVPDPRRAAGDLTQGRFRPHPDRAEGRADQAVRGPAGHRRRASWFSATTPSTPWPSIAFQVNQTTQNIGARRLYTIMERLLEELSFEAPDMEQGRVEINAAYVTRKLEEIDEGRGFEQVYLVSKLRTRRTIM